ncbi:unnamed protein product [Amoebophrya sp. A120]|nr:unnamed protein product [Amoebophrya sp. A120]|eukprot:GSA120T00011486001.1
MGGKNKGKGRGNKGHGKGGKEKDGLTFAFQRPAGAPAIPAAEQSRYHCKCKKFSGRTSEEVAQMIADGLAEHTLSDKIQLVDAFKRRAWDFVFIGVRTKDAALFRSFLTSGAKTRSTTSDEIIKEEQQTTAGAVGQDGKTSTQTTAPPAAPQQDQQELQPEQVEMLKDVQFLIEEQYPIAVKEASARAPADEETIVEEDLDRFGYKKGHIPTLMELKTKLATWSKQKNIPLVDKVCPLFKQYDYDPLQLTMKHTYTRTTCKNILRRMVKQCNKSKTPPPQWANVNVQNHGIIVEPILDCPQYARDAGYRNKCELSCGVKDITTTSSTREKQESHDDDDGIGRFEVGFVQRMDHTNEQVIGSIQDLPHVPASAKNVSTALKSVIKRSGLPVYRRHASKRAGFWRLVMCRVVDTDKTTGALLPADQHQILLVIQTTAFHDPVLLAHLTKLVEEEFKGLNLRSLYWQMNDGMSDAFDPNAPVLKLAGNKGETEVDQGALVLAKHQDEVERILDEAHAKPMAEFKLAFDEATKNCAPLGEKETLVAHIGSSVDTSVTDRQNAWEFVRGMRSNRYYTQGLKLNLKDEPANDDGEDNDSTENKLDGAQRDADVDPHESLSPHESTSTAAAEEDEEVDEVEMADQPEEDSATASGEIRTAMGNLMRARTKNEKKKKKNINVNPPQLVYHVLGAETLSMPLCGLTFTCGPSSFFQTNSVVTDKLYKKALTWAGLLEKEQPLLIGSDIDLRKLQDAATEEAATVLSSSTSKPDTHLVLDVCSGVGTIGCIAAKSDPNCQVVGVELIPDAVQAANENAKLNNVSDNCVFYAGKAEVVLPDLFSFLEACKKKAETSSSSNDIELDAELSQRFAPVIETLKKASASHFSRITAIVDPPRTGLHKDVIFALRKNLAIDRLVYVSCNPDTLCDDVVKLCSLEGDCDEEAFVPFKGVPVDMFPHTVHLEMILYLERYKPARHDQIWQGEPLWVQKMKAREEAERRAGVAAEPDAKRRKKGAEVERDEK